MTEPATARSREKFYTLLGFALFLACIALMVFGPPWAQAPPVELQDPDVKSLFLECGNADEPTGTGMPAWPSGKQRLYTRQHWTEAGELKVEVWEFLSPGHMLVSADREVKGRRITIEPRWKVPPNGDVAACIAKLGVEVTFRDVPRGAYVIDAR